MFKKLEDMEEVRKYLKFLGIKIIMLQMKIILDRIFNILVIVEEKN